VIPVIIRNGGRYFIVVFRRLLHLKVITGGELVSNLLKCLVLGLGHKEVREYCEDNQEEDEDKERVVAAKIL